MPFCDSHWVGNDSRYEEAKISTVTYSFNYIKCIHYEYKFVGNHVSYLRGHHQNVACAMGCFSLKLTIGVFMFIKDNPQNEGVFGRHPICAGSTDCRLYRGEGKHKHTQFEIDTDS